MNTTAKIEKEYVELLNALKRRNMTAEFIQQEYSTYNDVAEKTFQYLSKVALRSIRNQHLINTTGYEFDMFADDITMHILRKLDAVLACNTDYVIPYIITLVNNEVVTICRRWNSTYPLLKKKTTKTAYTNNYDVDEECTPKFNYVFNFLDDVTWSLIADETNIEENIIRQEDIEENHIKVIKTLENSDACSRFELVSLLATKVITTNDNRCIKTRALAESIDKIGLNAVSEAYFEAAASAFNISRTTYFTTFTNDFVPAYSTIEELCDKISKASNYCATKLRKKMGGTHANNKRAHK